VWCRRAGRDRGRRHTAHHGRPTRQRPPGSVHRQNVERPGSFVTRRRQRSRGEPGATERSIGVPTEPAARPTGTRRTTARARVRPCPWSHSVTKLAVSGQVLVAARGQIPNCPAAAVGRIVLPAMQGDHGGGALGALDHRSLDRCGQVGADHVMCGRSTRQKMTSPGRGAMHEYWLREDGRAWIGRGLGWLPRRACDIVAATRN